MKYILATLLILSFMVILSCTQRKQPEYCRLVGEIKQKFIKDMEIKHKLVCDGSGGSLFEQVNEISLSFVTLGPMSENELRTLLVTVVEDLLNRINLDSRIRPYLSNYPFLPANLTIWITLFKKENNSFKPIKNVSPETNMLYGVLLLDGTIVYTVNNIKKGPLVTIKEESYPEALEIVKNERPDLFLEDHPNEKL